VTQSGTPSDLDSIRQILFGADVSRLEQQLSSAREASSARAGDFEQKVDKAFTALEQRVERRLEEMGQRMTAQLDDLSRKQQAHADKVTQLLDQVMAELGRRSESLASETRAGFEELRSRAAGLEKRKLHVAEFGASLAALGQRYATAADETSRG